MTWNPFGKERPVHYGYEEVFNLDQNFTTVDMMVMKTLPAQFILEKWRKEGVDIPDVVVTGHSFTWRNELLPQYGKGDIAINANLKNGVLEGVMTGSPWSRVCEIGLNVKF